MCPNSWAMAYPRPTIREIVIHYGHKHTARETACDAYYLVAHCYLLALLVPPRRSGEFNSAGGDGRQASQIVAGLRAAPVLWDYPETGAVYLLLNGAFGKIMALRSRG